MIPRAYYNEKDAYAAQWLRKLAPRLSAGDKRQTKSIATAPATMFGMERAYALKPTGANIARTTLPRPYALLPSLHAPAKHKPSRGSRNDLHTRTDSR